MKPLIFRINAKDDGVDVTLNKVLTSAKRTGGQLKDAFGTGAAAADLLKNTMEDIKPPAALQQTDRLFKQVRSSADKLGTDVKTAFREAAAGAAPLKSDLSDLKAKLTQLGDEAAGLKQRFKDGMSGGGLERLFEFETLNTAAEGLRDNAGRLYDGFSKVGESGREMERALKRAFENPQDAERFIKIAKDLKHEYQGLFSGDQIAEGIGALKRFGVASEENLKRVAAMAAASPGVSLEQVSETYGEFKKAAIGGKHDFGSTEELRSQLGIDPAELVAFGAEVDKNNKLLGDTQAQATKAQKALDAYIDSQARFQGVAQRAADGQSKLQAEMDKFQGSIGKIINEWKNMVGEGVLPLAEELNNLPGSAKNAIAGISTLTPVLANTGAGALQMAAYYKLAGGSIGGAATMLKGFAAGIGGSLVAYGALAAAVYVTVDAYRDMKQAARDARDAEIDYRTTLSKAADDPRREAMKGRSVDDIIDEVSAEKDAGVARAKITDAIIAKDHERELAHVRQDKAAEERFTKEVARLKNWRAHMDANAGAEMAVLKEIDAAREANYRNSTERYNEMQKQASRGAYDSKKDELAALNAIIPTLDPNSDVRKEAEGKQKQLEKDAARERISDLKAEIAEKKALNQASLSDELKSIQAQLAIAKQMGKAGQQDRIQLYTEEAAKKAEIQKASDKKLKDASAQSLKDAAKVDPGAKTYDRGTGQAVDAYDKAIQRVKAWQTENAKLIAKFPELGQKAEAAIEQLGLAKASADVARMNKNFADLQREIKLAGDQAVTTAEKIAANEEAQRKLNTSEKGKEISKEQAGQLRDTLTEQGKDLNRQKAQQDLQHLQQMTQLREQAAQQELSIAESIANGSIASNDRILVATEKLHQFKLQALQQERDAAIAAGQDKLQAEERYSQGVINLERQRAAEFHKQAKDRADSRKAELQQIIDANKPAGAGKTGLSFGVSDNASFFSIGGTDEEYRKRKETKRAEAELAKINAKERFRMANPDAVAKVAEEERQRALRAADPSGVLRSVEGKMQQSSAGAGGPQTVTDNRSITANISLDGGDILNLDVGPNSPLTRAVVAIVEDKFRQEGYRDGGGGWL